jgi:DNA-binding NtrC family response regulator
VVPIFVPPLRERKEDIPLLVENFMRVYCAANGIPPKRIDPEAMEVLEGNPWKGNVRELENLVQRLALMVHGPVVALRDLPQQILYSSTASQESLLIPEEGLDFDEEMARIEAAYLRAALRRCDGKKVAAARLLRVDRQRIQYLCRKHGIRGDE